MSEVTTLPNCRGVEIPKAEAIGAPHHDAWRASRCRSPVEKRIDAAAGVDEHKTSTLQDIERGRPMELYAIVGSVAELGHFIGVPTPMIDTVYALTKHKSITVSVYR